MKCQEKTFTFHLKLDKSMLITLYVFLFFSTYSHAGSNNTTSSAKPSSSQFAVENELAKISTSCLNSRDYEMLAGNSIKHGTVRTYSSNLLSNSAMSIGLAELRRALHFATPRPWKSYNHTKPSEDELAASVDNNIEAYYDLIEPISSLQSLDNIYFFEKNIATAIAYLDQRLPSFRYIFRRRFEEMRQGLIIDRKSIDRMVDELLAIHDRIEKAISEMKRNDYKCFQIDQDIL